MEALYPGTYTWSTPVISQADPWMTGPANGCAISWQADNNTGSPIAPGAAFEIQGVFSTW